jgi:hypothetical protein
MRLSPLLAPRIPELNRGQACPRHAEVRCVENITRRTVHVDCAISETEDFEGREFATSHMLEVDPRNVNP